MPGQIPPNQVVYEFGLVRIDTARRRLERGGEEIAIPPRAFEALLLLVQQRGELVSKEDLLSRIWPDTHVEEANLPVMISTIRKAIGDDGRHQKYIQTVSKSGYRFIGEVRAPELPEAVAIPRPAASGEPRWRSHFARFTFAAGAAVAVCVAMLLAFTLVSGGSLTGYVKAASRAVSGGAQEEKNTSARRSAAELWCQKGRYAWDLHTKAGTQRSLEYFQNAVDADPSYAMGYAGLAMAYSSLPGFSQQPDQDNRVKARMAAKQALLLDDRLADTHIAAGIVAMSVERNFTQADKEFRRAVELDPRSALAEEELAVCLVTAGLTGEAVEHERRAKALDPLSTRATLGAMLFYDRRYMEAETEFEEVLKLNPYSYRAHVDLGRTYMSLGKFEDARRMFEEAVRLSNHDPVAEGHLAQSEALEGDTEGAKAILTALEQRARTSYVAPLGFAYALAGLGRMEEALVYLKKAYADRAGGLYLKVEPSWDALHGNREFQKLVGDMSIHDTAPSAGAGSGRFSTGRTVAFAGGENLTLR